MNEKNPFEACLNVNSFSDSFAQAIVNIGKHFELIKTNREEKVVHNLLFVIVRTEICFKFRQLTKKTSLCIKCNNVCTPFQTRCCSTPMCRLCFKEIFDAKLHCPFCIKCFLE